MVIENRSNSPCKDCEDRHLNCHSHCSRYQADAELRAAARKKQQDGQAADAVLIETSRREQRKWHLAKK